MILDIPMPEISPDFTIDDIHKIREWNYERFKNATWEERTADTKKHADEVKQRMRELKEMNNPK